MYSTMISEDTVTVTFSDGTTKAINRLHPQVSVVLDALRKNLPEWEVVEAFSRALAIKKYMHGAITISEDGEATYNGAPLAHSVVDRIVDFMRTGLPYEPLVNFLQRLLNNPSKRSVDELYDFLTHKDITIDRDGYLICYKAIRRDWYDKHSGTIRNMVGDKPEVPRNTVDDNKENTCSYGLHVGSIKYVRGFAYGDDHIVMVKVDPANVVSIPTDPEAPKVRVCKYEVIKDVTGIVVPDEAVSPMYDDDDYVPADDDDQEPDPDEDVVVEAGDCQVSVPAGTDVRVEYGSDGRLHVIVKD